MSLRKKDPALGGIIKEGLVVVGRKLLLSYPGFPLHRNGENGRKATPPKHMELGNSSHYKGNFLQSGCEFRDCKGGEN